MALLLGELLCCMLLLHKGESNDGIKTEFDSRGDLAVGLAMKHLT